MHSIEIDCFLCQPKSILPKPSPIQAHQSSKVRPDTSITFANFLGGKTKMCAPKQKKKTDNLLHVHYVMYPFAFKKKETVFYNITPNPAVTYIIKHLLEHDFHDLTLLYFFVEKFLTFYLGLTNA